MVRLPRGWHRAAGGWGFPSPGVLRPPSEPLRSFQRLARLAIRGGEGTGTAAISAAGTAAVRLGPDGLTTWYVSHVVVSSTLGAADPSSVQAQVGSAVQGIVPGGTSYSGGGDTIGMGGAVLRAGEYVSLLWSGGTTGTVVTATVYGEQDILA